MTIYVGADHRGFKLKSSIVRFLNNKGYQVVDVGAESYNEQDDYPDFARKVARKVSLEYESARGIVICGSGVGVNVVANKFKKIRCAQVFTPDQAFDARNDDDANVIALASDYLDDEMAKKVVLTWIETPFSGEQRHKRRIEKIFNIESQVSKDIHG